VCACCKITHTHTHTHTHTVAGPYPLPLRPCGTQVSQQLLEFLHKYVAEVVTDAALYQEHAGKPEVDIDDIRLAVQVLAIVAREAWVCTSDRGPGRLSVLRCGNSRPARHPS